MMNRIISSLIILCFCAFAVQPILAQDNFGAVKPTNSTNLDVTQNKVVSDIRGYTLGAGDEITVKVIGEADFDGVYTVDENGQVQLAFINEPISVSCQTEREVRAQITKSVSKYLRNPQVNVQITKRISRPPAVVYGAVVNPQQFDMRRTVHLRELLSYSGGVVSEGSSGSIQITHTSPVFCADNSTTKTVMASDNSDFDSMSVKYKDLVSGIDEANPVIRPGDVIYVEKAKPVYIVGEVRAPQGIYLQEDGTTLTTAIGQVGGMNTQAKTKDIKIYRIKEGVKDREMLSFNYEKIKSGAEKDILLQPYDIIEIGKAKEPIGKTILKFATGVGTNAVTTLGGGLGTRVLY